MRKIYITSYSLVWFHNKQYPIVAYFQVLFLILISSQILSQTKPVIDTTAIANWISVGNGTISSDGNYAAYTITNAPFGHNTLVLRATKQAWEKTYTDGTKGQFNPDGKEFLFQRHDTLFFITLGTNRSNYIASISNWSMPKNNPYSVLLYQLKGSAGVVNLRQLITGEERNFPASAFRINGPGTLVLLTSKSGKENNTSLQWIELPVGKPRTIWSSNEELSRSGRLLGSTFDAKGNRLVLLVESAVTRAHSIWLYRAGEEKAVLQTSDLLAGIDSNLTISSPRFCANNNLIWFELREKTKSIPFALGADQSDVTIWSYKEAILQPEQQRLLTITSKTISVAVLNTSNQQLIHLKEDDFPCTSAAQINGNYMVVLDHRKPISGPLEAWWPIQSSFWLVSLNDGSRQPIEKDNQALGDFLFSPSGQYLLYFDRKLGCYFLYSFKNGKTRRIIIPSVMSKEFPQGIEHPPVASVAGWMNDDSAVLLYDNYDLWKVDLSGELKPICLTGHFGAAHHVKLRLVEDGNIFSHGEMLLFTSFNMQNKYNGFYSLILDKPNYPSLLTMGPYTFYRVKSQKPSDYSFSDGIAPVKSLNANSWLVLRQSATEAPNYFFSSDLKSFHQLSNIQPQVRYNWFTTELVSWKMFDGKISQGILYKPANFDPNKKYPIIFNYYEQLSHRMYEFPSPEITQANINIPWFVSRGYLVFTPDINYKPANKSNKTTGEWAYNSVVSAAKCLSGLPYVDSKHMAIQGHSFGGLETNYLVTHTKIFAAAAEFAGDSDPISAYLTLAPASGGIGIEHYTKQDINESGQGYFGVTPWQRPDLYRRNSAVLNADKTTTPLLITHNQFDNSVQWRQGIEFYMALRRLGKKVWMLQYKNGGHTVIGKDALDYTIRLEQFFDYYLKGKLPPKWMTDGIPASRKGIDDGLELDARSGIKP